jgi:4-hydroxy-tetrahydrodipicolinate reductase
MNIALIGYGKMGRMIESVAIERGHRITHKIDVDNRSDFVRENLAKAQAAIEFTGPASAFDNVSRCLEWGIPVVSGSTGWYDRLGEAERLCVQNSGSMLCASNFSVGVNIFFEINRQLARIMNRFPDYRADIKEIHHTQKLDAPSGTAITLAEGIIGEISRITKWELDGGNSADALPICAVREGSVAGIHHVKYSSEIDSIEIVHAARNRKGFALGAVLAAEYIHDKKGVFTMNELLKIV